MFVSTLNISPLLCARFAQLVRSLTKSGYITRKKISGAKNPDVIFWTINFQTLFTSFLTNFGQSSGLFAKGVPGDNPQSYF